jgi:hypothetical protein
VAIVLRDTRDWTEDTAFDSWLSAYVRIVCIEVGDWTEDPMLKIWLFTTSVYVMTVCTEISEKTDDISMNGSGIADVKLALDT